MEKKFIKSCGCMWSDFLYNSSKMKCKKSKIQGQSLKKNNNRKKCVQANFWYIFIKNSRSFVKNASNYFYWNRLIQTATNFKYQKNQHQGYEKVNHFVVYFEPLSQHRPKFISFLFFIQSCNGMLSNIRNKKKTK